MRWIAAGLLLSLGAWGQSPEPPATPAAKNDKSETLRYNVNWPSGLSLGEVTLTSAFEDGQWSYSMNIEAAIPAFAVTESAKSRATADFCSLELEKRGRRGTRVLSEKTLFDVKKFSATRTTDNGGKSEFTVPSCAKDALTYVFFLRRELAGGRLPQSQQVYYGSPYQVRAQFMGSQTERVGGQMVEADRIQATIKGPASEVTLDLFFARDAVRTPLLVQAPLAMGKFSMELTR